MNRRNLTTTGAFISSKIGKAIKDYNLIEDGDKVLVGVSGGKDSLTLLKLLKERQRWSPAKFEIFAAHIVTDFRCSACIHTDILTNIFNNLDIKYVFKKIEVLGKDKKLSCFWCSWNRRKTLFAIAHSLGCNKIALGHHKDDIIETTLLNLLFQGEISTMNPRQELFNGKITIIRPLCHVEERLIKRFAKESGLPAQLCRCPNSQRSNRRYLKEFIKNMEKKCPNVKTNIFRSIARVKSDYVNLKED
jgi:tRNA 2-thiocytidine biosynthesis protein TtcA